MILTRIEKVKANYKFKGNFVILSLLYLIVSD